MWKTSCREDWEKCFKWDVNYDYEAVCLRGSAPCCVLYVLCGNSTFVITSRAQTDPAEIELRKPNCNETQSLGKWLLCVWVCFNDILGKAEIHFQGHLSCGDVSESVTLWPCHGRGWEWALGHRHVKSPQPLLNWSTKTERDVSMPLVILHLIVVVVHLFAVVLHHFFVLCLIVVTSVWWAILSGPDPLIQIHTNNPLHRYCIKYYSPVVF